MREENAMGACISGAKQFRYLRYATAMRFMGAIRRAVCAAASYFPSLSQFLPPSERPVRAAHSSEVHAAPPRDISSGAKDTALVNWNRDPRILNYTESAGERHPTLYHPTTLSREREAFCTEYQYVSFRSAYFFRDPPVINVILRTLFFISSISLFLFLYTLFYFIILTLKPQT